MPVLGGLDAAREIREQLPNLPILMITTSRDPQLLEISLEVGAQGFLNKNELVELLLPATESLLAKGTFFPKTA
jgi:two-component system NarL family response regulator